MHAFFQPAALSSSSVHQHYLDTITKPVTFTDHLDLIDEPTLAMLRKRFPDGSAQMWGVTPGKNDANVSKALKITPGDHVFFSGDKQAYLSGVVTATFRNHALAKRLWGIDEKGLTWEYMYAIDSVRGHHVPMDEIRELLGWKPTRNVQNLTHLSDRESELLQLLLGLDDVLVPAAVDDADVPSTPASTPVVDDPDPFDGPLEAKVTMNRRKEQGRLKKYLLRQSSVCALCGRVLPQGFLVAAHIKKRALCSDEERRDLKNIGMLACLLGCDSLFEHGYIGVDGDGTILISPQAAAITEVAEHVVGHYVDRVVEWHTPEREPYFAWHREHTYRQAPIA